MTEPTDDHPEIIDQEGANTYQELKDSLTDEGDIEQVGNLVFFLKKATASKRAITQQLIAIETMGNKTVSYIKDKRSPDLIQATLAAYRSALQTAYIFLRELQSHNTALTMISNQVQMIQSRITQLLPLRLVLLQISD